MRVFIFAGTTEGRRLAEILSEKGVLCAVSVATEYGANLLPDSKNVTVFQGRLNSDEMSRLFVQDDYDFIVDATHPFATEVSKEIKKACSLTQKKYLRLARKTERGVGDEKISYFENLSSATDWLENQEGKIFVSTGSKELQKISEKISDKSRMVVRVLPTVESLEICKKSGILQKEIIAMQGPFSEKMNEIQFSETGSKILLTKESGKNGGYFEKIEAAQKLGMKIAVIKNPENKNGSAIGMGGEILGSVEEMVAFLEQTGGIVV